MRERDHRILRRPYCVAGAAYPTFARCVTDRILRCGPDGGPQHERDVGLSVTPAALESALARPLLGHRSRSPGIACARRCGSMSGVMAADLAAFLAEHPPFDSLGPDALDEIARGARVERFEDGALIHDAFASPTDEVFVVVDGRVSCCGAMTRQLSAEPGEVLEPGAVFGFSAMLSERSIGPRAVAVGAATVARIPAPLARPAFASPDGVRFLADAMSTRSPRRRDPELQHRRRADRARAAGRRRRTPPSARWPGG